jgi:hypothetical protein
VAKDAGRLRAVGQISTPSDALDHPPADPILTDLPDW